MKAIKITVEMMNADLDLSVKGKIPVDELSATCRRFGVENFRFVRTSGRKTDAGLIETLELVAEIEGTIGPVEWHG